MLKSFNKKSNAKRAAEALVKKFPQFKAVEPIPGEQNREFYAAVTAPRSVKVIPDEVKAGAYVNGADTSAGDAPQPVAKTPKEPKPAKPAKTGEAREGSKTGIVEGLLLRKEGATAKEILAATGWKALNIPGTARAHGIKLRTEKDGRALRYFGAR